MGLFGLPTAAFIFLGCVAGFLIILVTFFLYLNKALCFKEFGGFPCIEKPPEKQIKHKKLVSSYAYSVDSSSSEDSEDDTQRQFAIGMQRSASMRSQRGMRIGQQEMADQEPTSEKDLSIPPAKPVEVEPLIAIGAEAADPAFSEIASATSGPEGTFDNGAYAATPEQENLFDVSDLPEMPPEKELISKCGKIEISLNYDPDSSKMITHVHQARDIPSRDRGGANNTQVRLVFFPSKRQRFKTKVKSGDNPRFFEKFTFIKVAHDEVYDMGIRFRLYGMERMRRERLIGESILGFAKVNLDKGTNTQWLILEPRSNIGGDDAHIDVSSLAGSDSASSTQSMQHGGLPELLLGLQYNGTTGRLAVEVIKGSNLRNMAMQRPPDTYVKVSLMSSTGQEVSHSKTSVRRGQPNPLYKETFMFQVALFQLLEVTLMLSVYNKRSMKKKEMIGWFSLGQNSSGEEEESHWSDMRQNKDEQICRWHMLLES